MITKETTKEVSDEWKTAWLKYENKLQPNRKTGTELLDYLQDKYVLTEIFDQDALNTVTYNITMNKPFAEKLPDGMDPVPKTFFLENTGNGEALYNEKNKDSADTGDGDITKIFVGIDMVTGFYTVEGSSMLWDEINAFRGLDEKDLKNCVCVSQHVSALKRFNLFDKVLPESKE